MIQKRQKHANAGNEKREGGTTCRLSCSSSNTPLVGLLLGTSDSRFDLAIAITITITITITKLA